MTQAYNLSQFANFLNTSGQVSASGIQSGVILASGTVSLFYQTSAPTGWTQVTTLNDYDMRIVSSSGGTTGGTTAYSTVFTNQTIGVPTVSATTLSSTQMPSHSHYGSNWTTGGTTHAVGWADDGSSIYASDYQGIAATGGGGSHTHSVTGGGGTITLNVRYANIILCSKN